MQRDATRALFLTTAGIMAGIGTVTEQPVAALMFAMTGICLLGAANPHWANRHLWGTRTAPPTEGLIRLSALVLEGEKLTEEVRHQSIDRAEQMAAGWIARTEDFVREFLGEPYVILSRSGAAGSGRELPAEGMMHPRIRAIVRSIDNRVRVLAEFARDLRD